MFRRSILLLRSGNAQTCCRNFVNWRMLLLVETQQTCQDAPVFVSLILCLRMLTKSFSDLDERDRHQQTLVNELNHRAKEHPYRYPSDRASKPIGSRIPGKNFEIISSIGLWRWRGPSIY